MQEKGLAAVRPWFGSLGEKTRNTNFQEQYIILFTILILLRLYQQCVQKFFMTKVIFFSATLQDPGFHLIIITNTSKRP